MTLIAESEAGSPTTRGQQHLPALAGGIYLARGGQRRVRCPTSAGDEELARQAGDPQVLVECRRGGPALRDQPLGAPRG